jgi:demethoxyubiquinone hydroxylase (CLK1/Coq7/Cat5 family)
MSYAVRLMGQSTAERQQLIRILQAAYSGELAAAYAYRGHWKSLHDPTEQEGVQRIEQEEWAHRAKVGHILSELKSGPSRLREIRMSAIGRTVGMLCHLTGWFMPMYFAGRLEGRNVCEYDEAARHARSLGLNHFESELRVMAAVEREHEVFFMRTIATHRLLPLMRKLFGWG